MTSIDKLLIQGIRSFSPQNRNVIEFFKPLTLIVGTNGAGKTTIIECLKYACTGELPPNSRNGQAFIHDTKVAREREVKAQIKMLFKAVTGKSIVATRSLQLTQKANAQQCKTIESALKTYNASGDVRHDIDKQIPELMGVSKAVLENVIFCHQEDSNWPLDEPGSLKKKFDDIFASTRYTQVLEVIKKQQKQHNQLIKEFRLKLQTAQVQLDHVHKLQKQLQEAKATISRGNEKMAQYDQSISALEAEITARKAKVEECMLLRAGIQPQLDALKQQEAQVAALREELGSEDISETDEEIATAASRLQAEEEANVAEIERLKQLVATQQQEKLLVEQRLQITTDVIQRIRVMVEENAKKVDVRDRKVIELALRYEVAEYTVTGLPFTAEAVQRFVEELRTRLQALRSQISQLKESRSGELRKVAEQIEELQRNRGQIQERVAQHQARETETAKKLETMQAELAALEDANTDIRKLESEAAEAEAALATIQQLFNTNSTPAQIVEVENEQQQLRTKMTELSNALKYLNKQTEARSAVNLRRRNCEEKESRYHGRLATHKADLEGLLGACPPEELVAKWRAFASAKKQALANAIAALQEARVSASEADGEWKSVSESLNKLTTSLEEKQEKLAGRLRAAGIDSLPDAMSHNEKATAQLKKDLNWAASLKSTYARFEKDAQESKECPLCHRNFPGDGELDKFRNHIHDRVANLPAALEAQRRDLAEKEKLQKALLAMRHDWEDIERMKDDVAQFQCKNQELTKLRDGRKEQLASLQASVDEAKTEEGSITKLSVEVDLLHRDSVDLQKARKELEAEEGQLRKLSSDTRTIEEVSQQYQQLQTQSDALANRLLELRKNREALSMELKAGQDACHSLRTRLFQAQSNIDKMSRLRTAIEETKAALVYLHNDIPQANRALGEIAMELTALEARRSDIEVAANKASSEAMARHDALLSDLQYIEREVGDLQKNVPAAAQELDSKEKERAQAELRLQELVKSLQSNSSTIEVRAAKSGGRQKLLQRLQATLVYRKGKATVAELTKKIESEVAHIGTVDVQKLTDELASMEKLHQRKREKRAEASGALAAVTARIREHEAELGQASLKHAEEEHRTLTVQCKTTEMANKDLEKYYHALDKALMKYHTAKIDEINKIVKELWQQTYRGQDIDTIEIHADQGDANKARSYNYRVVMRKGDTELDMRGRCSAGQKVLASLVLRLALAETFGLNCGILALDEPTTNLDRANVESFANALISIIEQRRHQANFQLIVITHDEEFVEKLGSAEHASHYWRVTKDVNQHSLLEQRDIKDFSA